MPTFLPCAPYQLRATFAKPLREPLTTDDLLLEWIPEPGCHFGKVHCPGPGVWSGEKPQVIPVPRLSIQDCVWGRSHFLKEPRSGRAVALIQPPGKLPWALPSGPSWVMVISVLQLSLGRDGSLETLFPLLTISISIYATQ